MATVSVRPMSSRDYEEWHDAMLESYADDVAKASGASIEAARQRARAQDLELLPSGLQTEGTWLLVVSDEQGTDVGTRWVGPHPDGPGAAYVFDIEIHEAHRQRGLGRAAMKAAEQLVMDAGIPEIGLNVFGFNEPARRLYESLGYRVVATRMTKTLQV
jgi:ribosomal protein S18 acetylase RimI-like enzyme